MADKYNIRENWIASFNLMASKPVVLLPFIIIAFLEALAVELIYFSPQRPLADIASPVMRKFFGEIFVHYPGNLIILPKLFYYTQMAIYIFIGVFLTAISVIIVKNVRTELALKSNALVKSALRRYVSFFLYGVIVVAVVLLLKKSEGFIFSKLIQSASKHLPQILLKLVPFISTLVLFLSNIILQTFLVLTVPIIVIRKSPLFKALGGSIILGWQNFSRIFALIFLPLLFYLPIVLLKTGCAQLIEKTFPEITLFIIAAGIIAAVFVECFIIVCAAQLLLDIDKSRA